jgi:hypothetical protein
VNSADELSLHPLPRYGRFTLILFLSTTLHLLLLWLATALLQEDRLDKPAKPKPLHLTLAPPKPVIKEPKAEPKPSEKTVDERPVSTRRQNIDPIPASKLEPTLRSTAPAPVDEQISTASILTAAKEQARQMATHEWGETKQRSDNVASILDRALNPQKASPEVMTLADGTIRVVTKQGSVYCVRPNEDWRFLGPEENPPLNSTCK